jgi:hypothetical protein
VFPARYGLNLHILFVLYGSHNKQGLLLTWFMHPVARVSINKYRNLNRGRNMSWKNAH